ncbi:amidohydrolase family protein [Shimia sp. MIT910701]|uniref:amidohydrolase family protein n=1 Tax=Shimia sp. MIT910701 TaxID=3096987 RepID=UPI0039995F12
MRIDAHHHLWDLSAVHYPWLMAQGVERFFGDPTPIQRNYLLDEFTADAKQHGISGSVHIQVGAENPLQEALWVQEVAEANPHWPLVQVAFCDLTSDTLARDLDRLQNLSTLRGVRQIVGRAPDEDAVTGTNALLENSRFLAGLKEIAGRGLRFDLQLIPELMEDTAHVLAQASDLQVALCHAGSPHDRSVKGLEAWANELKLLSALPNVSCKLSGLGMFDHQWTQQSIAPIVQTCLTQFGQDRVMFGSNFPVDSLYSNYTTLFAAMETLVPNDWHAAVFGDNAARFYELKA